MDREPWVNLLNGRMLEQWTKQNEITYNQRLRQETKYRFYQQAFDYINCSVIGDYYEFGCHRARTFRMALTEARRHSLQEMMFYAFDSFKGLPAPTTEPSYDGWKEGELCTSKEEFMGMIAEHGIYIDRVKLIAGFYRDSLNLAQQQLLRLSGNRAALVCIDCDLYESAIHVFSFIERLIQEGTILYLDDMFAGYKGSPNKGVAKAFYEYCEYSEYKFVEHMQVGWFGRSYIAYK